MGVRQARRRRQFHLELPLVAAVGVEVALEPDGDRPHHAAPLHRDELSRRHSLQFVRADPAQIELGDRTRLVEQLFSLDDDDLGYARSIQPLSCIIITSCTFQALLLDTGTG